MTRFILVCLVAITACAQPKASTMTTPKNDVDAVRTIVAGVSTHIDQKQWPELRALFATEVETDYTSLFGGEIQKQSGDALIDAWRGLLTPIATQHLLGPIEVTLDGDRATAVCHVRGDHVAPTAPSGEIWTVAGHYVFELVRGADGWRIRKMTLRTLFQTGNKKLLQEAKPAS